MEEDTEEIALSVLTMTVVVEGGLLLLAYGLGWLFGQPPTQLMRWDGWHLVLSVLATLPLLALFGLMFVWPVGPLRTIKEFADRILKPLFEGSPWSELFAISLLAGVCEEVLFRGVLQTGLEKQIGVEGAIVAASVLFGLAHAVTPAYAVLAGLMGAYLGWLAVSTGNLLVPILVHTFYDFVVLAILARPTPAQPNESPHD